MVSQLLKLRHASPTAFLRAFTADNNNLFAWKHLYLCAAAFWFVMCHVGSTIPSTISSSIRSTTSSTIPLSYLVPCPVMSADMI